MSDGVDRPGFTLTPALATSRERKHYIACPACATDSQRYLFHRAGGRFVICRACGLVYANPVDPEAPVELSLARSGTPVTGADIRNAALDFELALRAVARGYERKLGRPPRSVVVIGSWDDAFAAHRGGFDQVHALSVEALAAPLDPGTRERLAAADVVLLHDLLERVSEPDALLSELAGVVGPDAMLAVEYSNMSSLPSRVLRRRWRSFFDQFVAYYSADNLSRLMWRMGFEPAGHSRLRSRYSADYVARRLELSPAVARGLALTRATITVGSGHEIALFRPRSEHAAERLSIIVPVYNEERYVGAMLSALLDLQLPIDHEIIVVESNSRDRSREIVSTFEDHPLVTVIYQDSANGKGSAVREGLDAATGSIMLIQDADFEYDLDDYPALLDPILERQASFVLGSRNLGLDDWRIRRFTSEAYKGLALNVAHLAFARTFNLLYQQRTTDINTMFKVFRRECMDGVSFSGDGFNFDIELVCKIVRNGYAPFEVPVNYESRGFDEGKKITLGDAWPSYSQIFRCRFGHI